MTTVLCVDDDRHLNDLLRYALSREGWSIRTAETGQDALRILRMAPVDVIILDVKLPDMNGFDVLSRLRLVSSSPVIMLTALAEEDDTLRGFHHGADDYVTKPASVEVLVHRIKAVLRRTSAPPQHSSGQTYRIRGARFNPDTNEIVGHGVRVALTPAESRILHHLLLYEGRPLSAERMMHVLQGAIGVRHSGAIKTHIRHLRSKINQLPGTAEPIQTERGAGYSVRQTDEHGHPWVDDAP